MSHSSILVVLLAFLMFGLLSQRLQSTALTGPMLFAGLGLLIGPAGADFMPFSITSSTVHMLAEITLILVLFSDAAAIDFRQLRRDHNLPVRMLLIGMPLTIALTGLTAFVLLTEFTIWEALLLGAILAPTDAALGQAVITNPLVPVRIRQALNVESGLNDGIALPLVLIFAALASAGPDAGAPDGFLSDAAIRLAVAPLTGIFVGYAGGRLVALCYRKAWMSETAEGLIALALAFGAFQLAEALHGNGFISAFVGGLAFGNTLGKKCKFLFEFAESEGQLLILATFMVFGAVMVPIGLDNFAAPTLIFAILALTVLRMLPVSVSLFSKGISALTSAFIGWFGPRGLASILFGLLIVEESNVPHKEKILAATIITVMLSILLHGFSAASAARRYGAYARTMGDCPENMPVSAEPFAQHDARQG
jgi:NhaP-type Na+/H+ or K+/H+ antiporter